MSNGVNSPSIHRETHKVPEDFIMKHCLLVSKDAEMKEGWWTPQIQRRNSLIRAIQL